LTNFNGFSTTKADNKFYRFGSLLKEVYTVEDVITLPVVIEKDLDWQDSDFNFDDTAVMEKLMKLKSEKSPGSDGIHPLLLKECAFVLVEPLSLLFSGHLTQVHCQQIGKLQI